jgi:ribose transport system permease protein
MKQTAEGQPPNRGDRRERSCLQTLRGQAGAALVLAALAGALSLASRNFATFDNLENILRLSSFIGIVAAGETLVILTGGIDLGVGSYVGLTGCLAAGLMTGFADGPTLPPSAALAIGIGAGALMGLVNGGLIAFAKMPPFIVTLAAMMIARGLAEVYTNGQTVSGLPASCNWLTGEIYPFGPVLAVPVTAIVMLVVFAVLAGLGARTSFGRSIYAVGGNQEAARLSGVNVARVKLLVYAISGALSGLAGVLLIFRLHGGISTNGDMYEMDAIAACVIGGTSLSGGVGTVGGTLIGILIMGCVRTGLTLLNVSANWQRVIIGLIILAAVGMDLIRRRMRSEA